MRHVFTVKIATKLRNGKVSRKKFKQKLGDNNEENMGAEQPADTYDVRVWSARGTTHDD